MKNIKLRDLYDCVNIAGNKALQPPSEGSNQYKETVTKIGNINENMEIYINHIARGLIKTYFVIHGSQ